MRRLLVALLLAVATPLAAAADDAGAWLARVGPAVRGLDYQGTLVVVADGRMEMLRVFHRLRDGREQERLVALSGPPREVVRDGDRVMCIGTGDAPVAYDLGQAGRWSAALAVSEAAGLRGYRARLGDEGRVAGHPARQVDVVATDRWRYGYRLWLEPGSGLPLRVDLLDETGRTLEQVAFTEVEIGTTPADEDLQPSTRRGLERVSALPPRADDTIAWRVAALPPGFRLRTAKSLADGGAHLLFSDGLASVSVYVERGAPGLRGGAAQQRGAVHARSFWVDGWRVTAIGKVPAATVDHLARNLRPRGDG